ncbi:hypothetical protein [Alkalitalea saponilacus]|uniref:SdiA-regulated n=1 Tax=Alkalitalea saponilacus TaxID=889453 RepID=A0A1T5BT76_9BACT|nr:hypothetical protein [Alkalitalea saponilacus]ASB49605.1 hypothetical protein CDL62_10850 [Alkalitalea saponilacus]SKB50435.1 hypothetical protein SAMN03080601_00617 [Alkalitalea saponilacus]
MRFIICSFLLLSYLFICGCDKKTTSHAGFKVKHVHIETMGELPLEVPESSGLIVTSPNRIWTHNDSSNPNELYLIDSTGVLQRTLMISNATNIDWEDLAIDSNGYVYINDAGNNNNDRKDLKIWRIPHPDKATGNSTFAHAIAFTLEDQTEFPPPRSNRNFCIEAIIWKSDSIFMFTKDRSEPLTGYTKMYGVPASPGSHTAKLLDSLYIGNRNNHSRVTGADINFETGEVILLTRSHLLSFTNYPGNRFFKGEITDYRFIERVGQVEGVGFINGSSLYISEESDEDSRGFLYRVNLAQ